jgi:hypothetical protein
VGIVAAGAWSLRALATPTVGFDARALWLLRSGWFLHSHAQILTDLRLPRLALNQSAYPPLVSAAAAVAWRVTGVHTARLGVTTVAVLNACALAAAALALVECGRVAAVRLSEARDGGTGEARPGRHAEGAGWPDAATGPTGSPPWAPMLCGVVAGVLLVPVTAGVTEPFLTNGYADPLWSLAAVGATAFGLQSRPDRSTRTATVVLILVAGLTKDEGLVMALALIALVAARSIGVAGLRGDWRRWWGPMALGAAEVAVLAWWPVLMRVIGARGATTTFTTSTATGSRVSAVVHGMSPYLHVLVLALPLAVLGGVALSAARRRVELGHDLWAWLALAVGLVAVGGALVTGTGAIEPWIRSTVHRITEYPILQGWWIVAVWAVAASCGSVVDRGVAVPGSPDARDDRREGRDGRDVPSGAPVGAST